MKGIVIDNDLTQSYLMTPKRIHDLVEEASTEHQNNLPDLKTYSAKPFDNFMYQIVVTNQSSGAVEYEFPTDDMIRQYEIVEAYIDEHTNQPHLVDLIV